MGSCIKYENINDFLLPLKRHLNNNCFCHKNLTILAIWLKFGLKVHTSLLDRFGKFKVFLLPGNKAISAYVPGGEFRILKNVLGPGKEYWAELRKFPLPSVNMMIRLYLSKFGSLTHMHSVVWTENALTIGSFSAKSVRAEIGTSLRVKKKSLEYWVARYL